MSGGYAEGGVKKIDRYTLEPETDSLVLVREFINTALLPCEPIRPFIPDIISAAHEACINSIVHNPGCLEPVDVTCKITDDFVMVEVTDKGKGFDNGSLPPDMPDPNSLTGRGLFIICSLMDEVEATSTEDGTTIKMYKHYSS